MRNAGWKVATAASLLLYYSGGLWLFERVDRRRRPAPRCTVLSYHRVANEQPGYRDIAVTARSFRAHLDFLLRRGYRFLSLPEYHEYLSGGRSLQGDSILITFDDGYRDNYTAAFPMLRESGVPAAVFLCTGPITDGSSLWWDRATEAIRALRSAGVRSVPAGPDVPQRLADALRRGLEGSARRASAAIGDAVDILKAADPADRERAISTLERLAPRADAGRLMMTWEMAREMHDGGIAFGAHSVSHPAFSSLAPDAARAEIAGSRDAIARELGTEVTAFAYPYGKEDFLGATTTGSLAECGIRWAYTTENGRNEPGGDPLALRRNGMRDVPPYVLAARLSGIFEHPAFARLRGRLEGRHSK